ncbi:translation initiation factor IF-2-like [Mustela erminea]|uniref:translation initiation factor IF-2-like n=1 Tax=Mustela erminea TaxID=36723 RepID=UPI001386BEE4|nr:translation initiation factor IF-2-like [Mustela erminea]
MAQSHLARAGLGSKSGELPSQNKPQATVTGQGEPRCASHPGPKEIKLIQRQENRWPCRWNIVAAEDPNHAVPASQDKKMGAGAGKRMPTPTHPTPIIKLHEKAKGAKYEVSSADLPQLWLGRGCPARARQGEALPGRLPHAAGLPRACAQLLAPGAPADPAPAAAARPTAPLPRPGVPTVWSRSQSCSRAGNCHVKHSPGCAPPAPGLRPAAALPPAHAHRPDRVGRGGAGPDRGRGRARSAASVLAAHPSLPPAPFASSRPFCLFSYNRSKIFNAVVKSEQFSQWIPAGRRECLMRVHSFFHSTGCGFSYSSITYYITVIFQVLLADTGRYMIQDPEGISI